MAVAPIVEIDAQHPQPRVVERAVSALASGGLLAYPTDTYYGIGCDLFDKRAIERIYQLKGLPRSHELSFVCQDLAEISRYAIVDNSAYRVLRRKVPGPFTFILPATRLVPDLVLRRQKTRGRARHQGPARPRARPHPRQRREAQRAVHGHRPVRARAGHRPAGQGRRG
jgi:tRNA A37 threonylcarbamoyladenosine synthetase subunit TsaC/SUA5/YrdC